ncbi:MAG: aminopeptidase P N-terminal domain-containing protein [Kofleriaceae bacterium]
MRDPAIFAARRQAFMDRLGANAVAVVASLPERLRNGDSEHLFRQHSDVHYLTGFAEPQAVVVVRPGAPPGERVVMFVRPRDPEQETWNGRRAGVEGAVARFGADVAYPVAELDARLPALVANVDELHYSLGLDDAMDLRVAHLLARLRRTEKKGQRPPRAVVDLRSSLHELRLIKGPDEIATLRRAAAITADAHRAVMRQGRPGVGEHELEATLGHAFRAAGGSGPGYTSIVGAGVNATILHYVDNDRVIGAGELVLVDAGCEYEHYTADVTRTFPADGTFTDVQRRAYQLVLDVQKEVIAMARPGATLEQLHDHTVRGLTSAMIELGLLEGPVEERVKDASYKRFYMHGTSHWLGMDVHDAGAYTQGGTSRPLLPGMVITVEPGLYVAADAEGVPDTLRGLGIRIEDDILITADGPDNLTAACPKEVAEVEAACRG